MNKICKMCGNDGENIWKDGKYCCSCCGAEIEADAPCATPATTGIVNTVCPVCKNVSNNVMRDGKIYCSLCGTEINPLQQQQAAYTKTAVNSEAKQAMRTELEKRKNNLLIAGIVCVFCCWPVSIYFFYKMSQVNKEIEKL